MSDSLTTTRHILQFAVKLLFDRAGVSLLEGIQVDDALRTLESFDSWSENSQILPLRVLFDHVNLNPAHNQEQKYYWLPQAIANEKPPIPYPQKGEPTEDDIREYLKESCTEIKQSLNQETWQNSSWLSLIIEKYGSYIALGNENIALVDLVRSTAAVAAALAKNTDADKLSLIVGDLSGVQKFIYTISSAGALKSLRARSFYLELVTEEIVQQLLESLKLSRTNIVFAGASKLYILAADSDATQDTVKKVRDKFNQWLQEQFQGKAFLALDSYSFPVEHDKILTQDFAAIWSQANKNLDKQRSQRFRHQLSDLLDPKSAHEPCKVCHRDDYETLEYAVKGDTSTPLSCDICSQLYNLGEKLFKVAAVVRSPKKEEKNRGGAIGSLQVSDVTYHLFRNYEDINFNPGETLFLVNDWNLAHYTRNQAKTNLLLLGNYGRTAADKDEETGKIRENTRRSITAEELAEASQGIKRVGYVRMDVDNLGQIFARGLKKNNQQSLPQIASLSRQMTYFFKVYLNSLAADRDNNPTQNENYIKIDLPKKGDKRDNLLFIYAGGDDLFISGAWNEIVEFSFDIYQCFRAYTAHNPDITISAGIELAVPKFPLYQAAKISGDAEKAAKDNGRDSLTLFGETFQWDEWLGAKDISISTVEAKDRDYWQQIEPKPKAPELLGVLPVVARLNSKQLGQDYARNFVHNLVNVSNLQRQKLKEIADKRRRTSYKYEDKDIKYYLHLPQIAYTLSRLPKNVLDDDDFRKALKNPYNAPYYRAIATWIELLNR